MNMSFAFFKFRSLLYHLLLIMIFSIYNLKLKDIILFLTPKIKITNKLHK